MSGQGPLESAGCHTEIAPIVRVVTSGGRVGGSVVVGASEGCGAVVLGTDATVGLTEDPQAANSTIASPVKATGSVRLRPTGTATPTRTTFPQGVVPLPG